MMRNSICNFSSICLLLVSLLFGSCSDEVVDQKFPEEPFNPYDTLTYNENMNPAMLPDSTSFLGLHTYIFTTKCAVPACHDGSFEPDFRTVQSAYSTLVYHPVIKNTPDSFFTYRVLPGDTNASWLYERLTTDDQVLGRMPLYDNLHAEGVADVAKWINNGAPDILGNLPSEADFQPSSFGYLAYLTDNNNLRVDTMRYLGNQTYPFMVPSGTNMRIYFGLFDTNAEGEFLSPASFSMSRVLFNENDPANFSNANELNLVRILNPFIGPYPYGGNFDLPYFYYIDINTGDYSVGDIVYFRAKMNDGAHQFPTEFPEGESPFYLLALFSFIVQ